MADGILDNRETDMTKSQVMDIAMDMGRILLKSGAETSRVEDTMMRFCRSHGYYDLNVFCTPTIIILGDESAHGKSRVFRVRWRAIDLGLIMDINNLSYNFKRWGMTYHRAKEWMRERIRRSHPYGNTLVCLASGVGSAAFAMLLGGNWHDFVAAFICGFAAMGVLKLLNKLHPTAFWETSSPVSSSASSPWPAAKRTGSAPCRTSSSGPSCPFCRACRSRTACATTSAATC